MKANPVDEIRLPETIVVGVDDRGMSDHAVRAALALGERLGARTELLHAVRVPIFEWFGSDPAQGPSVMGRALEAAEARVEERLRGLLGPATGGGPRVEVRAGTPAEVLVGATRDGKGGMIVLGKHDKRGLVDFGSTARSVLAKGSVPVWVQVRPPSPVTRILAAVDLSADSARALAFACRLAVRLGASIRAVHFFDVAALYAASTPDPLGYAPAVSVLDARARVSEEFDLEIASVDWQGVEHTAEVQDGAAADGILRLAESADLVVLGTHGRTGLAAGVLGGVAHGVLKRCEVPVLAVPNPSRRFRI